ncbi:MAG: c-type cytochrome domain-containing protein [Flavitalea sp.]
MSSIVEFIGRFHPVLVHLPIGILLLGSLFLLLSRKETYQWLQPAIDITLLAGMISAILSCISGYLLSQSGDYEGDLVNSHQWLGIGVAVVSAITYLVRRKKYYIQWQWVLGALMILLIVITGHQGGSLTHGEDYLTQPLDDIFSDSAVAHRARKPIPDIQQALTYNDVIQPILEDKCYTCHSVSKQKGKLRMDEQALLMKGGKNGEVIVAGSSIESEMIKRILLPRNDEHHMAPKEKTQVTAQETELLKWWIDNGADFVKKVKEIPQSAKVLPALLALQAGNEIKKTIPDVPESPIGKADETALQKLKEAAVLVLPVGLNSNYLSANFIMTVDSADVHAKLLLPVKNQLVWLDLGNTKTGDEALKTVALCSSLTRLHLENTLVTDKGIALLSSLKELQSLNLVGTKVTASGLSPLKDLKHLQHIYLYQSGIQRSDWEMLKKIFPHTSLDSGGYRLQFLPSDTIELNEPIKL